MELRPVTASTRDGTPLSLSRTPSDDLAPYVARFFITIIDRPADAVLTDFLLHENAYVRLPLGGEWSTAIDGDWVAYEGPLLFGAQRRRFPVRCVGPIMAAGFSIRPAGWFAFADMPASAMTDRLLPIAAPWADRMRWACQDIFDHELTFARLDECARDWLMLRNVTPDATSARFERFSRLDPTMPVTDVAHDLGLSPRQLDRIVRQHFGLGPKTVMRRSRFIDMAAVMRGLAVLDEDKAAELRFYDASHLNREFREFVDMTPAQFRRTPTPLFTPGLEVRQQMKRAELAPEAPTPWLDMGARDSRTLVPAAMPTR